MKSFMLPHNHDTQNNLENLGSNFPQVEKFETVADVFKQLSDTTRIRIFWLLCHTEQCVINIFCIDEYVKPCHFTSFTDTPQL